MTVRKIAPTPSAHDHPLLIKYLLETPLTYRPDQVIVYQDTVRHTYRALKNRIHRLADVLASTGIRPGDTVAIMDWDSHRFLESFYAVPMMGAVLHPVHNRRSPSQLIHTINHAEDRAILLHEDFLPVLEGIWDQLESVKTLILLKDGDRGETVKSTLPVAGEYEALLAGGSENFDFPDFEETSRAALFYTAAASGTPKGVCFSHRELVTHTFGIMAALSGFAFQPGMNSHDVYMPLSPMFHVNAWNFLYFFTLLGAKQVFPGKLGPDKILRLIQEENVTFSHCDPTMMHTLLHLPDSGRVDLSRWKVITGGAPLQPALCKQAVDRGIDIFSVYGMAETGPLLTMAALKPHMRGWPEEKQIAVRCRTGLSCPMVTLAVMDKDGRPLPHDGRSIGEVVARAPWFARRYEKDPDRSERLWRNGWLHTGDIGWIDSEGYLQITDRIRDAVKTGGEWIGAEELEDILCEHEAVNEAAVVSVPDETWGEKPLALVVLKDGFKGKVTEKDLHDFCEGYAASGRLPRQGTPDKIAIVDTIPTTSVGKISKKQIFRHMEKPLDLKDGP